MKKNSNYDQSPPHLLNYWVKVLTIDGPILRKKILFNIKKNIKPTNDDDDEN